MIIGKGCGNDLEKYVRICEFSCLERLNVQRNSLKNVNSLVISNNPLLKSIEIDDSYDTGAFCNVKSVKIEGLYMIMIHYNVDLPQLTSFFAGNYSFLKTSLISFKSSYY